MIYPKRIGYTLLLLAMVVQNFGCGSSSPSNNNAVVAGYSVTGCTAGTSGQASQCIPTLGTYGNNVVYEGNAIFSNPGLVKNIVRSYPASPYSPGYGSSISNDALKFGMISVSLTASSYGPSISMAIMFPALGGQWISGYTTFTANQSTNPSAGTVTMQTTGTAFNNSMTLTSLQPWDGSIYSMVAVPIQINGQNAGSVGLTRVQ